MQPNQPRNAKEDPAAHAVGYALLLALVSMALFAVMHWLKLSEIFNALVHRVSDCLAAQTCLSNPQGQ